jgi:hypothetical protein
LGLALEVLGVVIALWGIVRVNREFAPDEGLFDPIIAQVRHHGARAIARLRRLLGKPVRHELRGSITASAYIAGRIRGRKGFGRLARVWDAPAALTELGARVNELSERIYDERDQREDEVARLGGEIRALGDRMTAEDARLDERIRRVATSDVRLQLGGLACVIVGIGLQAIG